MIEILYIISNNLDSLNIYAIIKSLFILSY